MLNERTNKLLPVSLAFGAAASLLSCAGQSEEQAEKPNLVFIHIDDLGWTDLGYMGSGFYETPNVDNFAEEGLMFTEIR